MDIVIKSFLVSGIKIQIKTIGQLNSRLKSWTPETGPINTPQKTTEIYSDVRFVCVCVCCWTVFPFICRNTTQLNSSNGSMRRKCKNRGLSINFPPGNMRLSVTEPADFLQLKTILCDADKQPFGFS